MQTLADGQQLHIDIYGYESANHVFHIDVLFYAVYDSVALDYNVVLAWRQEVHDRLTDAYIAARQRYEQELAFRQAEAQAGEPDRANFGRHPAENRRLIMTELKKHCIAFLQGEHVGGAAVPHLGEPPQFDLAEAAATGTTVRFLEHAFE